MLPLSLTGHSSWPPSAFEYQAIICHACHHTFRVPFPEPFNNPSQSTRNPNPLLTNCCLHRGAKQPAQTVGQDQNGINPQNTKTLKPWSTKAPKYQSTEIQNTKYQNSIYGSNKFCYTVRLFDSCCWWRRPRESGIWTHEPPHFHIPPNLCLNCCVPRAVKNKKFDLRSATFPQKLNAYETLKSKTLHHNFLHPIIFR